MIRTKKASFKTIKEFHEPFINLISEIKSDTKSRKFNTTCSICSKPRIVSLVTLDNISKNNWKYQCHSCGKKNGKIEALSFDDHLNVLEIKKNKISNLERMCTETINSDLDYLRKKFNNLEIHEELVIKKSYDSNDSNINKNRTVVRITCSGNLSEDCKRDKFIIKKEYLKNSGNMCKACFIAKLKQ